MTRPDRYMLGQLLVVFGFFSLVLVHRMNRTALPSDRLAADAQPAAVSLELAPPGLPNVRGVPPMAALAAAIQVTSRLRRNREAVVLQAPGIGPFRLPLPRAAMVLSAAAFTLRHARFGGTRIDVILAPALCFTPGPLRSFAQIPGEKRQLRASLAAWAPPVAAILPPLGLLLHLEDG